MRAAVFLYIDPLKQGLKQKKLKNLERLNEKFLYIDPLKQGLKHNCKRENSRMLYCFYT